jgi:hypothetical protein
VNFLVGVCMGRKNVTFRRFKNVCGTVFEDPKSHFFVLMPVGKIVGVVSVEGRWCRKNSRLSTDINIQRAKTKRNIQGAKSDQRQTNQAPSQHKHNKHIDKDISRKKRSFQDYQK